MPCAPCSPTSRNRSTERSPPTPMPRSCPAFRGLGVALGARLLAKISDDHARLAGPRSSATRACSRSNSVTTDQPSQADDPTRSSTAVAAKLVAVRTPIAQRAHP
jgi:hypothetical protein